MNLLKKITVSPFQLIAFIFKAYSDYGFTYSKYRTGHHHNGLNESDLPTLIHLNNGDVTYSGTTNLTNGQLKQVIEHRTVTISTFLDNGDNWHCFFITYQSLRGEENWENGKPHYHYISDKFGLTRDKVLTELKSKH